MSYGGKFANNKRNTQYGALRWFRQFGRGHSPLCCFPQGLDPVVAAKGQACRRIFRQCH